MAAGGELVLDDKFLKLLFQVDDRIKKISQSSGVASQSLIGMFDGASKRSLPKIIKQLEQLQQYYTEIGKDDSKGMKRLANNARKAAEDINRLIQATQQFQSTRGRGGVTQSQTLSQERESIEGLRQSQERLNRVTTESTNQTQRNSRAQREQQNQTDRNANSTNNLTRSHRGLLNISNQLQRRLALIFSVSQIQQYLGKLVQVRKEFELQQRSLQILVQNQNEANKLWNQTVQLAVKSPFKVKELVTYTKQLAAYRIETEKLHDTTRMLADVSAGLGVDMNRLILAYGQVRAAEFLRGTELRQFTEAGIPMLEELSKHFSELEGRAVSTADVFERISKRMVVFEDVDAVFKKITSEGGTFYKMQEKQSETLYGMIANLHDSLDLMMNDIGKSNEWVLKGAVSLTKTLVEQWRVLADVIAAVGIGVMYKQLNLVVRGFQAAAVHSTLATKSLSGMALMGAKANVAFKTLSKTLTKMVVAHPWIAIGVAIAAAARAVWQYSDAIDRANKKYDDMSRGDMERINKLQQINAQIKENNSLIKDSTKSQQIHNKAQENNNRLLEELKALYPDVYREIKMQSNGILEVSNEIDRQNRLLRLNISLQQQAKGGAFFEDLSANYNDLVTQMTIVESKIQGIQNKAVEAQTELLNDLNNGAVSQPIYDKFNTYLQQLVDAKDLKEVGKILEDIHKFSRSEYRFGGFSAHKYLGGINTLTIELSKSNLWKKIWPEENFLSSLDRMMSSFSVGLRDIYNTDGNDAAVKWLDEQLDLFNILDKKVRDIAKRHIVQEVGINLEFKSGNKTYTEDDLEHEWQKVIWGYIKEIQSTDPKIAFGITIEALVTKDKNKIVQQLQEQVQPLKDEISKKLDAAQNLPEQVAYSDEQVNKMEKTLPLLEGFAKALALWKSPKGGGTGKDWFAEMGKAIRDTHKDFLTLHKDLDETRALELALEKHSDVFAEAAKGAKMVGLSLRDFSSLLVEDNAISALEDLLGRIPETASKSRLAIEKMIGELRGGEEVRAAQERYEELNNQIEQLFGTYELSLELQDMNIPTDIAEKLFGFESLDLEGLKEKLKELEPQFIGTDQEKKYRDYLQKVETMEDKALKDRIKKFYKFLQDTTDAIQVAQQEGALDIQFATELFNSGKLTAEQYNQAVRKIIADTNKEISKLNLDKFKDSPEYIAAMGDMAGYTAMELTKLQNAIKNLIAKSSSTMQPEEIKAYNDALDKINDQLDRLKSPFSKTAISEIKEINRLNKELDAEKEKQQKLEQRRNDLEIQERELTSKLANQKYHGAPQEEIDETISKIQETQEGIADINGDLNTTAGNIANIGDKLQKLYGGSSKGWAKANKALTETFKAIDGAVQIFNEVKDLAASFGADVDTGAWSDLSIIFSGISEMSQKFQSSWQSFMSGDIAGGIAGLVGGIFSVIKLFNQLHDNKLEKQIKQQEHQVKLMGKAYEKLEKQMEGAYSTDSIKQNTDEMLKNLEEQVAAYEKMAELEQAKKDTDKEKVEQYLEERDKALEEREKLLIEREKAVGGFGGQEDYKSASEEFVDAWLSAFKETGSGLSGLQEKFDEFFINMIKKQLLNNVMEKSMTAFYDDWDAVLADGRMDAQEAESLKQAWKTLQGELDSKLQAMTEVIGVADDIRGTAELGTLQKGIQGVTEDTAEIIASYLNAIRFMLGEQSSNIKSITDNYGNIEAPNTMLGQLKMIADNTRAINDLLGSVTKAGHREGGYGIKVFTD